MFLVVIVLVLTCMVLLRLLSSYLTLVVSTLFVAVLMVVWVLLL